MKLYTQRVRQRGVTLIELVISIVILSIAMVAVMSSFSLTMKHSADPLWRNKTLKLAQLFLDEILSKNYDHNTPVGGVPLVGSPSCVGLGPDAGEIRATYNDVDDYHGLIYDGPGGTPPVSITAGGLDSSYSLYHVSITVTCDGVRVGATGTTPANNAKKITVAVTPPYESPVSFSVYKGNF
jgi:MSHA pilin protein MshD